MLGMFRELVCLLLTLGKWRDRMKSILVLASLAIAMLFSSVSEAQGPGGLGGRPSFDMLLGAFDSDKNGDLASNEVPDRVWFRLSRADSDKNGVVTRTEFESVGNPN
jgi:hypothetical protein